MKLTMDNQRETNMKKNEQLQFYCPKCNWVNERIKEKSNENWTVVNPNCDKCGTPNSIRLITIKKNEKR
jgi:peptide subunit release factor 1 (eRF1)